MSYSPGGYRTLKLESYDFYAWLELDGRGEPKRGKPYLGGVVPPDARQLSVYVKVSGRQGTYEASADIAADASPLEPLPLGRIDLDIPHGGRTQFVLPLPLEQLKRGAYAVRLTTREGRLGELSFTIN